MMELGKEKEIKIETFQREVINYYIIRGRKEFPWRNTKKPWEILLSEILLRKTTARQVVPIYKNLIRYTTKQISQLDQQELINLLSPIGMYKIKSKQISIISKIINDIGEKNLEDENFLLSLPGIGNYTKNCVQCFAYDKPKPALDTNMIRILNRVFDLRKKKARERDDNNYWDFAEKIMPIINCREFNYGILDIGAEICRARNKKCGNCNLRKICLNKEGV